MKEKVYVILGPTASGKTAAAIELAKRVKGEIVSADSMQIYRDMDIGTAKPSFAERQGIVHRMLDFVSPLTPYSVAMFQQGADGWIRNILTRGKTPVIAGGTGLYLNSLTYKLDFTSAHRDTSFRDILAGREAGELYSELSLKDPASAERIHPNDKKRTIRRLEILKDGDSGKEYQFRVPNEEYNFVIVGLSTNREVLYGRINARVDQMMKNGLLAEARQLFAKYGSTPTSMQAIGYKELITYLEEKSTLEDCVELLKKNSRHYAKRQLTWFRRDERIKWYDTADYETPAQLAEEILKQEQ